MWPYIIGAAVVGVAWLIKELNKSDEKTAPDKIKILLLGLNSSGKTTFVRHLRPDVREGPTGSPQDYDEITDMPGSVDWMMNVDAKVKASSSILFFFDVTRYVQDSKYQEDANSRIDFVHRSASSKKPILLVATHIDLASDDCESKVTHIIAGKGFRDLMSSIVFVNTTTSEGKQAIITKLETLTNYKI
ncbi:MAG: GTPase domain-containing protein [Bacteroidales bacterium]|nr:GTPase domain-containing protein [Bacteroidales bacterium]MDY4174101.1 GTPase domain-containing protein [Bacteroidales bacterium]